MAFKTHKPSSQPKMTPTGSGTVGGPGGPETADGIVANTGETNTYKTAGPYPATHGAGKEFSQVNASTMSPSIKGKNVKGM
jgi:hypothetical protein